MELASMLAGEPFTDHPRSVAPSIAAFMRSYNDLVDDTRRQDLYRYAADAVGTAGSEADERLRAERLRAWAIETSRHRRRSTILNWFRSRRARGDEGENPQTSALHAIHMIRKISDETHAAVLALLEELLAIGSSREPEPQTADARSRAQSVSCCAERRSAHVGSVGEKVA